MNCDCGTCADIYDDDREEDYIIERLTHIEEEIAYIKKILKHKRIKEQAMEKLKVDAEKEEEEIKKEEATDKDTQTMIHKLMSDIEKEIEKMNGGNTTTSKICVNWPRREYRHPYPWNLYTWI